MPKFELTERPLQDRKDLAELIPSYDVVTELPTSILDGRIKLFDGKFYRGAEAGENGLSEGDVVEIVDIDTSSLATTGSNAFVGNQTIDGTVTTSKTNVSTVFANPQILTNDVTLPSGSNAVIFGPVEIESTIDVGEGNNLLILDENTFFNPTKKNTFTDIQTFNSPINIGSSIYGYKEVIGIINGNQTITQINAEKYTAVFFDYLIKGGQNIRSGTITSVWDTESNEIKKIETSTDDIGDTSVVTFNVTINNGVVTLTAVVDDISQSNEWVIKVIIRTL